MSLVQVWQILWVRRWHLLLCVAVCAGTALFLALQLPPTYEARARVRLEIVEPDLVTGQLVNEHDIDTYVRTQQLLVLGDRVAGKVVDKLGWATNQNIVDAWTAAGGGAAGTGDVREWAGQRISGATGAVPLEGSGTLDIIYRAPDPEAAAAIVRLIRESYIETSLEMQTEGAKVRAARYDALAAKARASLAQAEAQLRAVLAETGTVIDPAGQDFDQRNLAQSEEYVLPTQLRAAENAAQAARNAGRSPLIAELRKSLAVVEDALTLEGSQLGASNPRYISLVERQKTLRAQLAQADAAARAKVAGIAGLAQTQVSRPEAEYRAERARLLAKAPAALRIVQAQRVVALRRGDLARIEDTAARLHLLAERTESGLVVMGDAITNETPVAPKVPLIVAVATLFGLMLGVVAALLDGLVGREVLGAEDLAFASGVPVLGVVPADARRGRLARLLGRWRTRRPRATAGA